MLSDDADQSAARAAQQEKRAKAVEAHLAQSRSAVGVIATVECDGHCVPVLAAEGGAFQFTEAQRKAALSAHKRGKFVPAIVEVCRHDSNAIKGS